MVLHSALRDRADDLAGRRVPYVEATVVRAERPTSARPGDSALVLADGGIEGFVGGTCAESSVRAHGLDALESGEPVLLRILPDAGAAPDRGEPGAVTVHNPCLSGGSLEIFLQPRLPAPLVAVLGETPIARALARMADALGYAAVGITADSPLPADAAAVVVASHGRGEEAVLRAALTAGVPYVGLVASPRRGDTVRAALDLPPADLVRLSTPAGLDIGARTPEEIALSILAEIVERRPRPHVIPLPRPAEPAPATTAVDPVCGMTVVAAAPTLRVDPGVWFCGSGCRDAYLAEPARYAGAAS